MRLSIQNFVWAADGLCALHKVPFHRQLLKRSFALAYNLTSLQAPLQSYGFQLGLEALDLHNLYPPAFPMLVILQPHAFAVPFDEPLTKQPSEEFEQIILACQLAGIQSIEQLSQGYQTSLGKHGTGLSGGQKQRIAIAITLLKQPNILIFDEAISNLNPQTAEQFALTINKLKSMVTIIFNTHQLPRGLQIDEVVQLDKPDVYDRLQDRVD